MNIIVNDASCLIDLRKAGLLQYFLALPYRFIVPLPIREEELLDFTTDEWASLEAAGLQSHDLPGEHVAQAVALRRTHKGLSANDCFALVTSENQENSILLTGDRLLRRVAQGRAVRVHGVLWVYDQLVEHALCPSNQLLFALETWSSDASVFLPRGMLSERIRALQQG